MPRTKKDAPAKEKPAKKGGKKKDDEDDEPEEVEELEVEKPTKGKKRAAKELDDAEEKPAKKGKGKGKAKTEPAPVPQIKVDAGYFALPKKEADQLKIISWNVAGFKSVLGKGFLEYLAAEDPDVICLQETKMKEEVALASNLPKHYHAYFNTCSHNAGYAGAGLLSKVKPIAVTKGIGKGVHDQDGRVLTAEYEKFYLVTAYVPNSGQKLDRLDYRVKEWDVDFLAYLKGLEAKKPVIWCGDLNVAHNPIDLRNPKTNKKTAGFTDAERASFSAILATGFVDSYRHFYPNKESAFTFWSYKSGARDKDVGWRLDYFIVSKDFMPAVVDSAIRTPIMGSDHCPILLLLKS